MCGICGFIGGGDLAVLRRMTDHMTHRGPDDAGYFHDPVAGVHLGHRRLSILDIEGGAQPMKTPDGGLVIVFNGEIYNHLELRRDLEVRGHRFLSDHSDTEVLLHGFREWGPSLPERLNGMWAFAIYDAAARSLFLSRDRFGKKPLFYGYRNGTFAFASELSALVRHPDMTAAVAPQSLKKYFAYGFIPAPHSLYRNMFKLPGGHNLSVSVGQPDPVVRRYWEFLLEPMERIPRHPEREWGERLVFLLSRAVKRRLMADVPLGVFLSGGLDSTSVAALAARESGGPVSTFSIGFTEASFDESGYARKAAADLGVRHHVEALDVDQARDILPMLRDRLDEPMGDASLIPTFLLCRSARRHVTVALGGDGADELFAGYDPFRALALARLYEKMVPKTLHPAISHLAARLPVSHRYMSLDFRLKRTLRGLGYPQRLWHPVWLGALSPDELERLFGEPTDLEDVYAEAIFHWDRGGPRDLVDNALQFYTRLYLQDDILVKIDRASMMNSLEVRSPYLDIDLVDFARTIPWTYKFRHGRTKYLLKQALAPHLPDWVIRRSKKGFGVPIGAWFQRRQLRIDPAALASLLDPGVVAEWRDRHVANQSDHRAFLFNYYLLSSPRP